MMTSVESTIKEFIQLKLVAALENFMHHVFPHLPESAVEDFYRTTYQELLRDVRNDMAEDFLRVIPFTPDTALAYIDFVFRGTWTSHYVNRFQQEAIDALGHEAPSAFARAICKLDPEVAQAIWDRHGPFQISLKWVKRTLNTDGFELNGSEFIAYRYENIRNVDSQQLRQWISLIQQSGAEEVLQLDDNGHTAFFGRLSGPDERAPALRLGVEALPRMINGKIENPELLLSFEQQLNIPYPRPFTRIPCLLPVDTASFFETAREFQPQQTVNIRPQDSRELIRIDISSITDDIKSNNFGDGYFDFNLVAINEGTECLYDDKQRINAILNARHRCGFDIPQGYVVCMIDTQELIGMPIGNIQPDRLNVAQEFCAGYFNIGILRELYDKNIWNKENDRYQESRADKASIGTANKHDSVWQVFDAASSRPELFDGLREQLGEKLFLSFCDNHRLSTNAIIALFDRYGYNNNHYSMRISASIVPALLKNGFRFADNSSRINCVSSAPYYVEIDGHISVENHRDLIKMGMWTGTNTLKPENLEEGLKALVRRPDVACLQGFILAAGIEEVAKVAKSEPQWKALQNLFSDAEIHQVIHHMPKTLKRKRLESDFEL